MTAVVVFIVEETIAGTEAVQIPKQRGESLLDAAVRYTRERKQFGRPIAEFQMIQAMLADMDAGTEAARQLLHKACVEIDAGSPEASRWSASGPSAAFGRISLGVTA